jgi:glyoxylase-like metal-dependent hydrolase (beta-lactamase superfamily II)
MGNELHLVVHGRGNAWPVVLGEIHPFYNATDPSDLSNAAFSLVLQHKGSISSQVLVDAGHGTIQSLITGANRIPECICLTHGHMDHTLSVDWVVQSYWKKHEKQRKYPLYSSLPVYRYLIQTYPQLERLITFRELLPGVPVVLEQAGDFRVTSFPVYHGQSAVGASMLLFEAMGRRVLFTGDLMFPLLRKSDYDRLMGVDLLVVDTNNRFPWPRTNHWSFAGDVKDPSERSEVLRDFLNELSLEEIETPHHLDRSTEPVKSYFRQLRKEGLIQEYPHSIIEFLRCIEPVKVVPVHYSGAEDRKYHGQDVLTSSQLKSWITQTAVSAGISVEFLVPEAGQVIPL